MKKFKLPILLLLLFIGTMTFHGQLVSTNGSDHIDDGQYLIYSDDNSTDDEDDDFEDSDDDGVDDDKEEAYERQIEYEADSEQFQSESTLKNGTTKDKFKIQFAAKSDDPAEIAFDFEKDVQINSTTSSESELSYKVKFDEIIEFVDIGEPGYQNETSVTTYEIGKTGWLDLQTSYNESIGLLELNGTTADGVFTLFMSLTSNFLNKNNVTLSPTSLKIDVIINDFDLNQTDTKLAVKSHIKTESELSFENESEDEIEGIAENETQVGISAAGASGFFSWSDITKVDDQEVAVLSSSIADSSDEEGETSSKMYFTFNTTNAKNVFWDPKLGVVSEAAKQNYNPVAEENPVDDVSSNTVSDSSSTSSVTDEVSSTPFENNETTDNSLNFYWLTFFVTVFAVPILLRKSKFNR